MDDNIMFTDILGDAVNPAIMQDVVVRLDALCIILIKRGECKTTLNGQIYSFPANSLIHITDMHYSFNPCFSEDFAGYRLIIDAKYAKEVIRKVNNITPYLWLLQQPGIMLTDDEYSMIEGRFLRIKQLLSVENNILWSRC